MIALAIQMARTFGLRDVQDRTSCPQFMHESQAPPRSEMDRYGIVPNTRESHILPSRSQHRSLGVCGGKPPLSNPQSPCPLEQAPQLAVVWAVPFFAWHDTCRSTTVVCAASKLCPSCYGAMALIVIDRNAAISLWVGAFDALARGARARLKRKNASEDNQPRATKRH